MKAIKLLGIIFLIVWTSSCSEKNEPTTNNYPSFYTPTATDVTATASLQDLQSGRKLYISNCASCHQLYNPDAYTPSRWNDIMPSMGLRTQMNPNEIQQVLKYLTRGK